jgi:predicted metal-binding membrane protein
MIDIAREVARVRIPLLTISALAWIALATAPGLRHVHAMVVCSDGASAAASLSLLLAMNPPSALAAGWALMLVAMMAPRLIPEIHHVRFTSLARRRARSIALFVAGYGGVWMVCGAVLTSVAFVAMTFAPGSYLPAAVAGLIAGAWQASPSKQICLNACHQRMPLRIFGREADLDAFRFGWTNGFWCAGSCGALMLLSMLLPEGHFVAMAAVTVLVYCEGLEDAEPPGWKMRGLGKAWRMLAARIRVRLRLWRDARAISSAYKTFATSSARWSRIMPQPRV